METLLGDDQGDALLGPLLNPLERLTM